MPLPIQRSFDDLGAPLAEVPFCVLDIETTGGRAADIGITEIGAVKYVGGRLQGTFQTLVDPGLPIPPSIMILTGITHAMVVDAPAVGEMIPALLEFIGDAVVVGHNVRYDLSFINAAAEHHGYGRLPNRSVDTAALARRLMRSEVRNLKLGTLAAHFRSPVTPNHRALADAEATAHVLWCLLERAGTLGVTHLEDLLALPRARGASTYSKIRLTEALPRRPGVYFFRDRNDEIIYVGKAKNLRSRVRSYFYGDTRRSVATMLRELDRVDHRVCATELEAEVTELRLIRAHRPRHNRRSKPVRSAHWIRLTEEAFPRLALARTVKERALARIGPFRGRSSARLVLEALWDATPVRRCTHPPGSRSAPCSFAQMGTALCPCDGTLDPTEYATVVERLCDGLDRSPEVLLKPLTERITDLAARQRFEEASWVRDRYRALERALEQRRAWSALQGAGTIRAVGGDGGASIERGHLAAAWPDGPAPPLLPAPSGPGNDEVAATVGDAEEARLIWKWLLRPDTIVLEASRPLDIDAARVPRLERIAV
ncbi:MAG: DEDD exonuclease domain-containing protein [Acidimicrobiia bacterium]